VLNLVEFGMGPKEAVLAPRTHHQWFPDLLTLEGRSWAESTRVALTARGHKIGTIEHQGNANTIVVDRDGRLHGIADPRRSTTKASGDWGRINARSPCVDFLKLPAAAARHTTRFGAY
jgi:gamma-glutamyltranspeptidase / glutathione hydrolase